MKISFVFPPSIYQTKQTMPPLGLAWLAAVLRENGYEDVKIYDCVVENYSKEDLGRLLEKDSPDIIGISFGSQNRFVTYDTIRYLREKFSKVKIIVGGPHPTLTHDTILKEIPEIDIVCRGEGEYTVLELVQTIEKGGDLNQVKGITFRRGDEVVSTPNREPIIDLDALPMPARDLLPIEKYQQKIPFSDKICTNMMTSRGCPYLCVYCSAARQWNHSIRFRSAEKIIEEIEFLINTYNLEGVGIFDEVFTLKKERAIEVCKIIIEKKLNISWWCEARAHTIDEEIVDWMKRAGCVHISMAIESGSQPILNNIKKAITVEQAINAVKIIKKAGIKLKTFFMFSLPGETYTDIRKTVFLAKTLEQKYKVDEVVQGVTFIYPGTEIEDIAKKNGVISEDFSWHQDFEETKLRPPLDGSKNMPIFEQPSLSYDQVYDYVRRAKIEYYLRNPISLIRNFKNYRKSIIKWILPSKKK